MAPAEAKSLSAAPSLAGLSVETGPSPLLEVLVGSEMIVELPSEPEPRPVPVLSAPDEVRVLEEPPPEIPLTKSVLSLSSALVVRVLPLPLPLPLVLVLWLPLPVPVAVSLPVPVPDPDPDPGKVPPFSQVSIIEFNSEGKGTSGQ